MKTLAMPTATFAGRFAFGAVSAGAGVVALFGAAAPLEWVAVAMLFTGFGRAMEWV